MKTKSNLQMTAVLRAVGRSSSTFTHHVARSAPRRCRDWKLRTHRRRVSASESERPQLSASSGAMLRGVAYCSFSVAIAGTGWTLPLTTRVFHGRNPVRPVIKASTEPDLNASLNHERDAENHRSRQRGASSGTMLRDVALLIQCCNRWNWTGFGLPVSPRIRRRCARRADPNAPIIGAASFLQQVFLLVELARNVKRCGDRYVPSHNCELTSGV
jgi:hypothetical protein